MAQLNAAYAVLSDGKQRREYDAELKLLASLQATNAVTSVTKTGTKSKTRQNTVPRNDVDLTLARELSKQLRNSLLAHHKGLSWEEKKLEGFDWGMEGSSWSSHYCVAGRGFGVLDPAAAKKFTNYSEVVIARCNRPIRKSHFLFLLPFQRLSESESVSAEFNRFFSVENHTKFSNIAVGIVLLDARGGRTTRFSSQLGEKRLEELVRSVSTAS